MCLYVSVVIAYVRFLCIVILSPYFVVQVSFAYVMFVLLCHVLCVACMFAVFVCCVFDVVIFRLRVCLFTCCCCVWCYCLLLLHSVVSCARFLF